MVPSGRHDGEQLTPLPTFYACHLGGALAGSHILQCFIAPCVEPKTKELMEGQVQPAAQKVADNAEPVAEDIIKKVIDPAVEVSLALACTIAATRSCIGSSASSGVLHSSCVRHAGPARSRSGLHRAAWQPLQVHSGGQVSMGRGVGCAS